MAKILKKMSYFSQNIGVVIFSFEADSFMIVLDGCDCRAYNLKLDKPSHRNYYELDHKKFSCHNDMNISKGFEKFVRVRKILVRS